VVVETAFRLRDMTASDAGAVARIGFEAWKSNRIHQSWFEPMVETRVEDGFLTFAARPDAEVVVVVAAGEIIGWGARDSREHPGDRSRGWDYISDLWITPHWQGKGVGSVLIGELLARMRFENLGVASIETDASNHAALSLYKRLGFTEVWQGTDFSPSLGLDQSKVRLEKSLP
jgi:ribosomal-protein-alanine N-acetyltransferase